MCMALLRGRSNWGRKYRLMQANANIGGKESFCKSVKPNIFSSRDLNEKVFLDWTLSSKKLSEIYIYIYMKKPSVLRTDSRTAASSSLNEVESTNGRQY